MYTILAPNTTCPGFSPTWRHCRSPGPAPAAVGTYILFNSKHRPKSAHIRLDVSTWRLQLWRTWYLTRTDNSTEIPYVSCLWRKDVRIYWLCLKWKVWGAGGTVGRGGGLHRGRQILGLFHQYHPGGHAAALPIWGASSKTWDRRRISAQWEKFVKYQFKNMS